MAMSRQKETRSRDYTCITLIEWQMVIYSAQYHTEHCTLQTFEQCEAFYMHKTDGKHLTRPVPSFEPQPV